MALWERKTGATYTSGFGLMPFSRDEFSTIHRGALHILEKVGLTVESEEAVQLFHGAGVRVTRSESFFRVHLPPYLVEECIRWAPKEIIYYGRIPDQDYIAQPKKVGFSAFGQCVNILDPITENLRSSNKNDLGQSARLQDALENIRTVARTVDPGDKYPPAQSLHSIDAIVRNTGKHISGGAGNARNLAGIIELLAMAVGGQEALQHRPFYTPSVCPTSPLTLGKDCCEVAIAAIQAGLGIVAMIMPLAGGTAPVTLAGTIALGIAEQLSCLVLAQLVRKGAPVTMGSASTIMDLRSGSAAMGAPEAAIINASLAQMSWFYELPSRVACGVSDAKIIDPQIGYEYANNAVIAALAGASIVFGGGAMEAGLTHSPVKLVMDHECMNNIKMMLKGITIDPENMALDVIADIGPGGNYLMHQHTFDHMRNQSESRLFNRVSRKDWLEISNGMTAVETAVEKAQQIIAGHRPPDLPPDVESEMDRYVEEFESGLKAENGNR